MKVFQNHPSLIDLRLEDFITYKDQELSKNYRRARFVLVVFLFMLLVCCRVNVLLILLLCALCRWHQLAVMIMNASPLAKDVARIVAQYLER